MTQTTFYSEQDSLWNLDWLDCDSPLTSLTSDISDMSGISAGDISTTTTTTMTADVPASELTHGLFSDDMQNYLDILAVDPTLINFPPDASSLDILPLSATSSSISLSDTIFWLPTPASSPTCTPKVLGPRQSPFANLKSEIKCAKRKYKLLDDHELKICMYTASPVPPPRYERDGKRERKHKQPQSCSQSQSQWVLKTPDDAEELLTEVAISGATLKKLRAEEQRTGKQLIPQKTKKVRSV